MASGRVSDHGSTPRPPAVHVGQRWASPKLLTAVGCLAVTLLSLGYAYQGYRSVQTPPVNALGHPMASFDVTPRLVGTRNLLRDGINPYGESGQRAIEEAYFGEPVAQNPKILDKHRFAYPLYVVFPYAPFALVNLPTAHLMLFGLCLTLMALTFALWFRMVWPEGPLGPMAWAIAYGLTWYATYSIVWQRQPAVFTFAAISGALFLLVRRQGTGSSALAGGLLFFSTIKPQSSLLVVVYLVVWATLALPGPRTRSFLQGFFGTASVATLVSVALVPTWIHDFFLGLTVYRQTLGKTGAEAIFGHGSPWTHASTALVVCVGIALAAKSLRSPPPLGPQLTVAFLLVAQAFALQCIHFVTIMAIPGVFLALRSIDHGEIHKAIRLLLGVAVLWITINQWWAFSVIVESRIPPVAELRRWLPIRLYDVVLYNLIPPLTLGLIGLTRPWQESRNGS